MPSSRSRVGSRAARAGLTVLAAVVAAACVAWPSEARAQQQVQGFALDRLYLSAPGAGWFAMDALDMRGGLGGVMGLTVEYARDPLRLTGSDGRRFAVVSDEAIADLGFAATYDRFRLYLNFDVPLTVTGQGGVAGGYAFGAPGSGQAFTSGGVNASTAPDTLTDARIGAEARLIGGPRDAFRLGLGAQLFVPSPNDNGAEYITDGTVRAMTRLLFAGDVGSFTYAAHLGVHIRPRDDTPEPQGPQGSELLVGAAAGLRYTLGESRALVVGPEVMGASAFRDLLGSSATALEGLWTARAEGTADSGQQVRVKLGTGIGSDQAFGAPAWRMVFGLEVFDRGGR